MDAGQFVLICGIIFAFLRSFMSADQNNITAQCGQNVTLTCRAPNTNNDLAEWSRADLGDEYVFLYRDGHFIPDHQHHLFKNRVDLQETLMKDGDVSVILKDVTTADSGTYMCCIIVAGATSCEPICNITLSVVVSPGQPGGATEDGGKEAGSVGLKVGLSVAAVVVVVAFVGVVIYRKCKQQKQGSFQPPAEQQHVCNVSVFFRMI
uniref:uncharacterized protein LOC101482210 n=1 Tax=Maylandia zebra TaxID=106582 RepID=UPI00032A1EBD|nr:uncharacterized protein LOC101482210 [Maylandia zebra]